MFPLPTLNTNLDWPEAIFFVSYLHDEALGYYQGLYLQDPYGFFIISEPRSRMIVSSMKGSTCRYKYC